MQCEQKTPWGRERSIAATFQRRALLLALLIHLFMFVAAPTYDIRVALPKPQEPIKIERLPLLDIPKRRSSALPRPRIKEIPDKTRSKSTGPEIIPSRPPPPVRPGPREHIPHDTTPKLIRRETPMYPENARLAGHEGRVLARLFVDEHGCVRDVRIIKGDEMSFDTVREAAYRMLFHSATLMGKPVGVWVSMQFIFSLE